MNTSESFKSIKLKLSQKRKEELIEEYMALSRSLGGYKSDSDELQIQRDMERLDKQITEIEAEIAKLSQEAVQTESPDHLLIRVVVVAMRREQADALDSGKTFAGSQDYQHYDELRTALQAHGVSELAQYYGSTPDDWSPFIGEPGETIAQLVERTVARLNDDDTHRAGRRRIEIKWRSCECFSNNSAERMQSWDEVEGQGGIVIVDAVSLHHPDIRQHLKNSQVMGANSHAAMIVLSPLKADTLPVNQLLRTRLYEAHLERAFNHFQAKLHPFWEFGVNDLCNLQRWLYATLPKIKLGGLPPAARQAAETFYPPAGINGPILGGTRP